MSERITKLQRWIDLIAYLVGRRVPVPWEELLAHVPAYTQTWDPGDARTQATVRRMFERDKDELRAHGIPLQTVRYSINFGKEQIDGYRIARRDFYLPYLKLIDQVRGARPATRHGRAAHASQTIEEIELARDDADLALEALRRVADVPSFPLVREARSAFRKLAFGLEAEAFPAGTPVLFVDRPGSEELLVNLRTLSTALLARKRLTFRYNGIYRNSRTDRTVEPFGLLFHHGHWYLIGHDSGRGAIRVFRVERMEAVQVNRKSANTPDYEVPQDFRLNAYANREPWELGGEEEEAPIVAHVLVRWPASLGMERNRQGALEATLPDGSAVRRFTIYQAHPFLRWMLSLEADAQILGPQELAHALQGMAREVASIHAPSNVLDGNAGDA
jgi:proteasome accessory factor B